MCKQIFEQTVAIFCNKFWGNTEGKFSTDFRKNVKQNNNQLIYADSKNF